MKSTKQSAGILLYRLNARLPEFFLVHPGGPFWAKKDLGAWSIPKGEFEKDEDPLAAAKREFHEETGTLLSGNFLELTPVTQKAGKVIFAWAAQGDIDAAEVQSNSFKLEWPPKSGSFKSFPEVDKAEWFDAETAMKKINPAQISFITELMNKLKMPSESMA